MSSNSPKPETYGRGTYTAVLVLVAALSVAGNVVYGLTAVPTTDAALSPGWAGFAHAVPPIILLAITEVLALGTAKLGGRGRTWTLGGVVVIAIAAFALSFDALYEVAVMARVRPELAWLVPVMLDVAIIVCTVMVLMAGRQIAADAADAAAPEVVTLPPVPVVTHADHAGATVDRTPTVGDHRVVTQDVAEVVTQTPVCDHPAPAHVTTPVVTQDAAGVVTQAVGEGTAGDDDVVDTPHDTPHPTAPEPMVEAADAPVAELPVDAAAEDLAAWVLATVGARAEADEVAEVLRQHRAGESIRAIAEATGRSRPTVKRWVDAAKEVSPEFADADAAVVA
ncbi:DUF2637 domain-containing protein [Gordonia sp. VNK1]|uniref:DUF2637 domain-containing protein n=1 Tax=Gordonia oleivorans TaxID=3156618 RepID=UPI0032B523A5